MPFILRNNACQIKHILNRLNAAASFLFPAKSDFPTIDGKNELYFCFLRNFCSLHVSYHSPISSFMFQIPFEFSLNHIFWEH